MKCVNPRLGCPLAAGSCDKDGECYLWRCEHPHAQKPESAATQGEASNKLVSSSPAGSTPAFAADPKDELAAFAELVLRITAARWIA